MTAEATNRRLFNTFNRYEGATLVKVVSSLGELQTGDTTCYPDSRDWKHVMMVEEAKAREILRVRGLSLTTNQQVVIFRVTPDVAGLFWHDGAWWIVKLTKPAPVAEQVS